MHIFLLFFSIALMAGYCLLITYYRAGWKRMDDEDEPSPAHFTTSISVLVAARNEAVHIRACVESLQSQHYPPNLFEIIVIDDHSVDDTAALVKKMGNENTRLIRLAEYTNGEVLNSYKKKAIEVGIAKAKGSLIVITDADCIVSKNWLGEIASCYQKYKPVFIAAPVAVDCRFNFLEMFQAVDFMSLQGITGAGIRNNFHGMCNGANLAYERSAFYAVDGFEGINDIASGDDMLLMHKIQKAYPGRTRFLKSRRAIVHTAPANSVADFFGQRIRWASKADRYEDKKITAVLLLVYSVNAMLLLLPIIALCFYRDRYFNFNGLKYSLLHAWTGLLVVKTLIELFFLFPVAGFFNKRSILWLFPLMQPFHIVYTVIAGWLGKFGTYQWKGRTVK